jgi:FAD:protein FMN transferase
MSGPMGMRMAHRGGIGPDFPPAGGYSVQRVDEYFIARFVAMASPCEILVDSDDRSDALLAARIAECEAGRIERKFSRYRSDNEIHKINNAEGSPVEVDSETSLLIDYAATCYDVSDGMFDITSGVLRRVWKFDGGHYVPPEDDVREALRHVGWHRVTWDGRTLTMPPRMEIDFGGIGKEYAVDRTAALIAARMERPFLVNFGGDLFASGPRRGDRPWIVGVDDPSRTGEGVLYQVDLTRGGLATSGDARRFVMWRGRRLGHILSPKTGWPVMDAPSAVTVIDRTCLEAGTLSTLAILQGPRARSFLEEQGVEFRIL